MKRITVILLVIALAFIQQRAFAQVEDVKGTTPLARAKNLFDLGDYKNAFTEYVKLLAENPEDEFLNWRVGLCHLYQNINKSQSIPYLRKVTRKEKFDDEVLFDMCIAYMYNEQIDSALLFFNKYKLIISKP